MTIPCAWCDKDFVPHDKNQKCCSASCGQHLRYARQRREANYPPIRQTNWRNHPTQERPYKAHHQRLREQLLPRAIGKVCPFYTTDPKCPGLMLQGQRLALDHHVAVALGGQTTLENVRITHHDCNLRAGARLGAAVRHKGQTRNCVQCGRAFQAWTASQTRCSHGCRQAAREPRPARKPKPPRLCRHCDTPVSGQAQLCTDHNPSALALARAQRIQPLLLRGLTTQQIAKRTGAASRCHAKLPSR